MTKKRSSLIWQRIPQVLGLAIALLIAIRVATPIETFLRDVKTEPVSVGAIVVGCSGLLIAWRRQLCGGLIQVLSAVIIFFILRLTTVPYASLISLVFALPGLYLIFGAVITRHGPWIALSAMGLMTSPWLIWNVVDWINYAVCKSYRSVKVRNVPDFKPGESMRFQKQRLINAFANDSLEELNQFFLNWQSQSTPISQLERKSLPAAVAHAYVIFEDFYRPHEETFNEDQLWHQAPYFIVQGTITVAVRPTLKRNDSMEYEERPLEKFSVNDFNPRLPKIQSRSVYLAKDYERMLACFLGDEHLPIGWSGDIMAAPTAIGTSLRRQEFLQQMATIIRGHWSGWRIVSDPKVTAIDFVPTLDEAVVLFESGYLGGEALYHRVDGQWILAKRMFTWRT